MSYSFFDNTAGILSVNKYSEFGTSRKRSSSLNANDLKENFALFGLPAVSVLIAASVDPATNPSYLVQESATGHKFLQCVSVSESHSVICCAEDNSHIVAMRRNLGKSMNSGLNRVKVVLTGILPSTAGYLPPAELMVTTSLGDVLYQYDSLPMPTLVPGPPLPWRSVSMRVEMSISCSAFKTGLTSTNFALAVAFAGGRYSEDVLIGDVEQRGGRRLLYVSIEVFLFLVMTILC